MAGLLHLDLQNGHRRCDPCFLLCDGCVRPQQTIRAGAQSVRFHGRHYDVFLRRHDSDLFADQGPGHAGQLLGVHHSCPAKLLRRDHSDEFFQRGARFAGGVGKD
ncbi:hypothetical protein D1872_305500 [compost metagenome]